MEYLTQDGLKMSHIGIGTYSLSGVYGQKEVTQIKKVINHAYELGVNFFDTAEAYGNAEKILGETIKNYRDKVIISTKVGIRKNTKPNLSYDYINSACEDSLKRLNTEYIDIYNLHFNDPDTPVAETIGALEDLQKEGKIRKYGLGHLPKKKVKEYIKKGSVFSVLMELSPISRKSSEELLPICRENNVGCIAFSITGRGLLSGKYKKDTIFEKDDIRNIDPQFQRERIKFSLEIMKKLKNIGDKYQMSSVQVAITWVLSRKGIITALTGPSSIEHLEENLGGSRISPKNVLLEIDNYIKEKEKWLKEKEMNTVKNLLHKKLSGDPGNIFVDLVYCIETSITNGLVEEQEIIPVFYTLYGMRNKLHKIKMLDLENIQKEIKKMIKAGQRNDFL